MLESAMHGDNCFLTLTYADRPDPSFVGPVRPQVSLDPKHAQDWLKRFRKAIEPARIRYFLVGEYGDETERPHYHAAIFGWPGCLYGRTRDRTVMLGRSCCNNCDLFQLTWGKGHVFAGTLEPDSASYIAGYVTKKLTSRTDPRLHGRHPEFARMSRRPGLGYDALHEVASTFLTFNLENTQADVPSALRHGKRILPLGRYLQKNLRKMVGRDEKAPQAVIDALSVEMLPLRLAAKADAENPSLRSQIIKNGLGKRAQLEAKRKIFKTRKTL